MKPAITPKGAKSQGHVPVPDPRKRNIVSTTSEVKDVDFSVVVRHFKLNKHYFGYILNSVPMRADPTVDTMCVGIKNYGYELRYHPDWYKGLKREEACGVLEHEALHITLRHIPRLLKIYEATSDPKRKERILKYSNYAADAAVNSIIMGNRNGDSYLPACAVTARVIGASPGESYEYYLKHLLSVKDKEDKDPDSLSKKEKSVLDTIDGSNLHGPKLPDPTHGWDAENLLGVEGDSGNEAEDIIASLGGDEIGEVPEGLIQALEKASSVIESNADAAMNNRTPGNSPGSGIEDTNQDIKLDNMIGKKLMSIVKSTYAEKEEYKRTALNLPAVTLRSKVGLYGKTYCEDSFYVEFCIDTSGSMHVKDIEKCLVALQSVQRTYDNMLIRVTEFDCSIQHQYILKPKGKINTRMHGRGGTNFDCVFRELHKGVDSKGKRLNKPDLIVIATDGEAHPPKKEYRLHAKKHPVAWLITTGKYHQGKSPCPEYGKQILV